VAGLSGQARLGSAIPTTERFDPIAWWSQPDRRYLPYPYNVRPSIYLPIQQHPANASEPLAVLRSSSPWERNSLDDNTIEALVCLRAWWNVGLIKRL